MLTLRTGHCVPVVVISDDGRALCTRRRINARRCTGLYINAIDYISTFSREGFICRYFVAVPTSYRASSSHWVPNLRRWCARCRASFSSAVGQQPSLAGHSRRHFSGPFVRPPTEPDESLLHGPVTYVFSLTSFFELQRLFPWSPRELRIPWIAREIFRITNPPHLAPASVCYIRTVCRTADSLIIHVDCPWHVYWPFRKQHFANIKKV